MKETRLRKRFSIIRIWNPRELRICEIEDGKTEGHSESFF
jgi:hypothetical protein